jgi:hypothetical protein
VEVVEMMALADYGERMPEGRRRCVKKRRELSALRKVFRIPSDPVRDPLGVRVTDVLFKDKVV